MEHKNETPDRIWIDHNNPDNQYDCGEVYITPNMVEYVRKDAACVEVREGYVIDVYEEVSDEDGQDFRLKRSLSEALTIRTVEDVRREVAVEFMAAIENLGLIGDHPDDPARVVLRAQFNTPAPSREEMAKEAEEHGCKIVPDILRSTGSLLEDAAIHAMNNPQPTTSPEPVAYRWRWAEDCHEYWALEEIIEDIPHEAIIEPLYALPPTPASHAEELRKAKAEAWDEGYKEGWKDCPEDGFDTNPYAAPERGE